MYFISNSLLVTSRALNGFAGVNARRRISSDKQGPTIVHQKPGPLQTIFDLLPDEASFFFNSRTERSLKIFVVATSLRVIVSGPRPQLLVCT